MDLPFVQRARDVAVRAASEGSVPWLERLHGNCRNGHVEDRPGRQRPAADRRHGASPSYTTATVSRGQRQKALILCRLVMPIISTHRFRYLGAETYIPNINKLN